MLLVLSLPFYLDFELHIPIPIQTMNLLTLKLKKLIRVVNSVEQFLLPEKTGTMTLILKKSSYHIILIWFIISMTKQFIGNRINIPNFL